MFRPFLAQFSATVAVAVQQTAFGTVDTDGSVDLNIDIDGSVDLNANASTQCNELYASWCQGSGCVYCANEGIRINLGNGNYVPILDFCCATCALPDPCNAPTTTTTTTTPPEARFKTIQKELDHFDMVNELRAAGFTCPEGAYYPPNPVPLKWHCQLFKASQWHSQDMADQNYFSHTGLDGDSPWDRAAQVSTSANGENIAAGSSGAAAVLEQWKNSDGHCRNMGKANFKSFAVGAGYNGNSQYKNYWTQMFSVADSGLDETSCLHAQLLQARGSGGGIVISEEDIKEADEEARHHDESTHPTGEPAERD